MPFIIQYKREYTHHREYRWNGTQNRTECQSGIGSRVVEMRGGAEWNVARIIRSRTISSPSWAAQHIKDERHYVNSITKTTFFGSLCLYACVLGQQMNEFSQHTHTANEPTNYTRNKGIARIRYELSHLALDILKCRLCVCAWVCFLCRSSQQNAFQKVMINCIEAETIVICLSLISCYANCSLCDGYMVWMTTPSRHNVITP